MVLLNTICFCFFLQKNADVLFSSFQKPKQKRHRCRNPNKLDINTLTGEERVPVVNKRNGKKVNTGKENWSLWDVFSQKEMFLIYICVADAWSGFYKSLFHHHQKMPSSHIKKSPWQGAYQIEWKGHKTISSFDIKLIYSVSIFHTILKVLLILYNSYLNFFKIFLLTQSIMLMIMERELFKLFTN